MRSDCVSDQRSKCDEWDSEYSLHYTISANDRRAGNAFVISTEALATEIKHWRDQGCPWVRLFNAEIDEAERPARSEWLVQSRQWAIKVGALLSLHHVLDLTVLGVQTVGLRKVLHDSPPEPPKGRAKRKGTYDQEANDDWEAFCLCREDCMVHALLRFPRAAGAPEHGTQVMSGLYTHGPATHSARQSMGVGVVAAAGAGAASEAGVGAAAGTGAASGAGVGAVAGTGGTGAAFSVGTGAALGSGGWRREAAVGHTLPLLPPPVATLLQPCHPVIMLPHSTPPTHPFPFYRPAPQHQYPAFPHPPSQPGTLQYQQYMQYLQFHGAVQHQRQVP